jgi:hypothetical protein
MPRAAPSTRAQSGNRPCRPAAPSHRCRIDRQSVAASHGAGHAPVMVLIDGRVLFVALSKEKTADWLTEQFGITPTTSWEAGDPVGPSGRRHEQAGWVLEFEAQDDEEPFDAALPQLVETLGTHETQLRQVSEFCHLRVVCSGSSDSVKEASGSALNAWPASEGSGPRSSSRCIWTRPSRIGSSPVGIASRCWKGDGRWWAG